MTAVDQFFGVVGSTAILTLRGTELTYPTEKEKDFLYLPSSQLPLLYCNLSHRIHVWIVCGIFTYIYHKNQPNKCKQIYHTGFYVYLLIIFFVLTSV